MVSCDEQLLLLLFNLNDEVSVSLIGATECVVFQHEQGLLYLPSLQCAFTCQKKKLYDFVRISFKPEP